MSEEPRDAFVAFITIDDDEIVLNFGPGDHTCERWRISKDQLRLIVIDSMEHLLDVSAAPSSSPASPASSP